MKNFYCKFLHTSLSCDTTCPSAPWVLKQGCVNILKSKVTHNTRGLQFHPISCIIYPISRVNERETLVELFYVSEVFFSWLCTCWKWSPVIINFTSSFNREINRVLWTVLSWWDFVRFRNIYHLIIILHLKAKQKPKYFFFKSLLYFFKK